MKTSEVEVILIGNELLKGERRDSHLAHLGQVLATVGVRIGHGHVVGDDHERIARLLRERIQVSRVVIVSGGLGPTHDDITREAVADALGVPLEFRDDQWATILKIFAGFGKNADDSNRRQAYFPQGSESIANARGTAAGFLIERSGCLVAVLPGPPRELIPMTEDAVLPRIDQVFGRPALLRETFRTTGIGESAMTPLVTPVFERFPQFDISSLPHIGGVDIVITEKRAGAEDARDRIADFEQQLRSVLGDKIYGKGGDAIEAVIGALLKRRGETLGIAESLTGGLIGARMTDTPGSSAYMLADVVSYSNESKIELLGVSESSLIDHGAVSKEVCCEMAHGIRRRTGASYGLATTGIAGPNGGTTEKPIGLTYFGLAWEGGEDIRHRVFPGAREDVRARVAFAVLGLLHQKLVRE